MIKKLILKRRLGFVMSLLCLIPLSAAHAAYPERALTVISPFSAGGDADLAARTFASAASRALGQPVVVLNKPGASGVIGSAQVVASPPDGYTLLLARTGSQAIMPAVMPTNTRYKWNDYTFIGMLEINPYGCVVNAKSPYKTFEDLTNAIKTRGETLNYGTAGVLTTNDMGPRQLFRLLKVTDKAPMQIPYKGTGEAVVSLLAGETQFSCGSLGTFTSHIKDGALRALMVTTPERLKDMPDVPTAKELGYPDMQGIVGWSAVYAPPGLPDPIKATLTQALQTIAKDEQWRAMTAQTGSLPYVQSPEDTQEFVRRQYELYVSLGQSLDIIDKKD